MADATTSLRYGDGCPNYPDAVLEIPRLGHSAVTNHDKASEPTTAAKAVNEQWRTNPPVRG